MHYDRNFNKKDQAYGEFNNGEIIENKPIGFPTDNGPLLPYSNIFYWAYAEAKEDSTIGIHPHKGFEIITFVLEGSIKHYDTLINKWIKLNTGDVQIIKARSGISHSEFLKKNSSIFQIWLDPNVYKSVYKSPEYKDYKSIFFKSTNKKKIYIGEDSNKIDTENIEIFELKLDEDVKLDLNTKKYYSIYVLAGDLLINNKEITCHDFIKISNIEKISIKIISRVNYSFCLPLNVSYETYK